VNLDTVIHLAGLDEQNSFRDIEAAWKINTLGTQSLLSIANDKRIQKFIYFSTFHVYGDCEGTITEETPAQPHHPYASTHRAAEDIVRFYQHYKNINTLTLRLSNAFGCPMDTEINRWALVFNDLCRQAMTSRKIIIKSSGKQYRNFISLHDVCADCWRTYVAYGLSKGVQRTASAPRSVMHLDPDHAMLTMFRFRRQPARQKKSRQEAPSLE